MCGICGVISFNQTAINTDYLKAMCDVIAHRGPDDAGYVLVETATKTQHSFTDTEFQSHYPKLRPLDSSDGKNLLHKKQWNIFLGHRRLAIIDKSSASHQPMSNQTEDIWITYNGEIYNFEEIKSELKKSNYQFKTNSDTEVIIAAYQFWGIQAINKFNGMFAFALWDKSRNLFFLARDRYGIKPLYYTLLPDGKFVFASEVKSILQYQSYKAKIDLETVYEYFTFQNIYTNKTFNQNIILLPPGNYLKIDLNQKNISIKLTEYWDFNFAQSKITCTEQEYSEELERLLIQAVSRQLIGDVEVGSYLSGGMDSGSITAIAAKKFPHLKTFTVGFDLNSVSESEQTYDERIKAEYLSYLYNTEHYQMVLKSNDMERCMAKLSWHLEEPRVGQSYPNYYAAKLAGKFVKVILSGVGSDELFAGYPWRYSHIKNPTHFENYIDQYYSYWQRLGNQKQLQKMFQPISHNILHIDTRQIFKDIFKNKTTDNNYLNCSLYFEAKTFLHGLLMVEDKLSMAHSLESRVPFLDNDLVDFALQLPPRLKITNLSPISAKKNNHGKMILRKSLAKWLPNQYIEGEKQGFSSPDQSWFKKNNISFIKNTLLNKQAKIFEYLDKNIVHEFITQHVAGHANHRLMIWSLLNFEYWCKHYVD